MEAVIDNLEHTRALWTGLEVVAVRLSFTLDSCENETSHNMNYFRQNPNHIPLNYSENHASIKIRPGCDRGPHLGLFWASLGPVLGPFWGVLGLSWGCFVGLLVVTSAVLNSLQADGNLIWRKTMSWILLAPFR